MILNNGHVGGSSGVDTGDTGDTGDIGHSLRFRGAGYASRTPSVTGDRRKWIAFIPFKRSKLGAAQYLVSAAGSSRVTRIYFDASDRLAIYSATSSGGGDGGEYVSSQVFRDPTSWGFLVIAYDSTQATAGNRIKAWVNDDQITSWSTSTAPTLNHDTQFNWTGAVMETGRYAATDYLGGYLARFCLVDGGSGDNTTFGYLNTEINEWVSKTQAQVKAVVDAGGTNSFMLDFDDGTSLTTLGYDKSSKGNNWTLNNFSLTAGATYDWMLDVPGNSFAVFNPLSSGSVDGGVASNGNMTWKNTTANNSTGCGSMAFPVGGKTYLEITLATLGNGQIGISAYPSPSPSSSLAVISDTTACYVYTLNGVTQPSSINCGAFASSNVMGVAVDYTGAKPTVQYYRNGVAVGTQETPTSGSSNAFYLVCNMWNSDEANINFGQRPFAHTPPTGFLPLCQRNLPTPAILNPKNGFVAVTAIEDNIDGALATARSGWTDYVDVKKNRAVSESWAWQFSHDSANEYAIVVGNSTRQAKRAMSGSDTWIGRSIRIGAAYGTAAGSVSHTTGAATTITHNVGVSSRQMIFLFNRAGGAVFAHHPDINSGELLNLVSTAKDALGTAITSVLTNSFQIGSATASGTYDYLVISELSQFCKLFKHIGNGVADGTYDDLGFKARSIWSKAYSGIDAWSDYDTARSTYNEANHYTNLNNQAAESTTTGKIDVCALGFKHRATSYGNANGYLFAGVAWADVAGKYSLAR